MSKMTKQELVESIKENFRDGDGDIDLIGLDFSGENVHIGYMKARNLCQNGQEVENTLFQQNQKVGNSLYQYNQKVKGDIYQDETKMKPR